MSKLYSNLSLKAPGAYTVKTLCQDVARLAKDETTNALGLAYLFYVLHSTFPKQFEEALKGHYPIYKAHQYRRMYAHLLANRIEIDTLTCVPIHRLLHCYKKMKNAATAKEWATKGQFMTDVQFAKAAGLERSLDKGIWWVARIQIEKKLAVSRKVWLCLTELGAHKDGDGQRVGVGEAVLTLVQMYWEIKAKGIKLKALSK